MAQEAKARWGRLYTPHGVVDTPVFMPVGTQATVKGLASEELGALGAQILLCNTYHLYLRPGSEIVAQAGGLHRFMHWSGAILTDSGGFQVLSLAPLRRLSDEGVIFRSHLDGSSHLFTPEKVVEIQEQLRPDIAMVLDECPPYPASREAIEHAVRRTSAWAHRSRRAWRREEVSFFAIVQGGVYPDLRERSARELVQLDFPGYAIGGLSVGEPKELTYAMLDYTLPLLPVTKPRYLMGVGTPEDILEGVARGVDMFDCVLPTRLGRHATAFTQRGRINLRRAAYLRDFGPLEEGCSCYTCRHYTRAYLHHLFRAGEMLGPRLVTLHNLHFLFRLTERIREAIASGTFHRWYRSLRR
ncbi:tRNA guanosine(34) transglycosylase Tgt [Desulfothermobacter acidiphilus]|uniref:tRNA guanosine(34) transglycosylase Tgt n=1 Tax=Desulfothermobacter acidiphilus TaxID=1938353 RepID=UPI003F8BBB72